MAVTQEPILSRLDRLDNLMKHLEELGRGLNRSTKSSSSPSTPSSGAGASSFDFSPRSTTRERKLHCRPLDDVIVETEHKGTLLDRLSFMEDRLLKLEEVEAEKKRDMVMREDKSQHKKGLKQFVQSCVKGSKGKPKNKLRT